MLLGSVLSLSMSWKSMNPFASVSKSIFLLLASIKKEKPYLALSPSSYALLS